jgi:hypothetical protein
MGAGLKFTGGNVEGVIGRRGLLGVRGQGRRSDGQAGKLEHLPPGKQVSA